MPVIRVTSMLVVEAGIHSFEQVNPEPDLAVVMVRSEEVHISVIIDVHDPHAVASGIMQYLFGPGRS